MLHPIARLSLATLALTAGSAGAFPFHAVPKPPAHTKPPAQHPKPPAKPDLLPGLRHSMEWAATVPYPWFGGPVPHEHHTTAGSGGNLHDALRDVKAAQAGVSRNEYTLALGKVQAAEHIVARDHKLAAEHKEAHRAEALNEIMKHLKAASAKVGDHRGHEAHDPLAKAAKELDALANGRAKPGPAKKPAKN